MTFAGSMGSAGCGTLAYVSSGPGSVVGAFLGAIGSVALPVVMAVIKERGNRERLALELRVRQLEHDAVDRDRAHATELARLAGRHREDLALLFDRVTDVLGRPKDAPQG